MDIASMLWEAPFEAGPARHRSNVCAGGKVPGCAFLNSFIPDAIGTVRVTPAAHIKNRKVSPKMTSIPALNPEEKRF